MSTGDKWDRLIGDASKAARQDAMDLYLFALASKLVNNEPINEHLRLALAESLLRIHDGEDPRNVFGPIKGKRQNAQERGATRRRDAVIARQVHYLVEGANGAHGSLTAACDFVAKMNHKSKRKIEVAHDKHKHNVQALWVSLQILDDPVSAFLREDDRPNLQEFLQKTVR